jgi:hypothetical protein
MRAFASGVRHVFHFAPTRLLLWGKESPKSLDRSVMVADTVPMDVERKP